MDSFYALNDKDFFEKWETKHEKVLKTYKVTISITYVSNLTYRKGLIRALLNSATLMTHDTLHS